jgi:(R)-2-hydroxyacyl-CoA dehydratese activating ATPase
MTAEYFAGIDVGSCTTKCVLLGKNGITAHEIIYSGTDFVSAAESVWQSCLMESGLNVDDIAGVTATGYGRKSVPFATAELTEISCHAKGCLHYFVGPMTIIDVGGQDNKIIKIDSRGRRTGFKMNRKCAAGTGAFLEEMALRLRIPLENLNGLAEKADGEIALGSYCTVFSATEVLEKIKAGNPVDRIVRGLFHSVVKRILEMDTLIGSVVLTGGVIEHNPYIAELLKQHTTSPVMVPPHPQLMGAPGAAIHASQSASKTGGSVQ